MPVAGFNYEKTSIMNILYLNQNINDMKKISFCILMTFLFTACGGDSGNKVAQEVCDCYSKANGMDPADPKRAEAQNDCLKKQMDGWNKVKDDSKKAEEFNKKIGECSKEMIKQSLGK